MKAIFYLLLIGNFCSASDYIDSNAYEKYGQYNNSSGIFFIAKGGIQSHYIPRREMEDKVSWISATKYQEKNTVTYEMKSGERIIMPLPKEENETK